MSERTPTGPSSPRVTKAAKGGTKANQAAAPKSAPPQRPAQRSSDAEKGAKASRVRVPPESLPDPGPELRLPLLGWTLPLPGREQLPFVAGLCLTVALDLIDWPVAAIVLAGHTIAGRARSEALREMAEGLEGGA